jgi:hypothetical protein
MLELEAFNLKKAKPEIAVQYVDHNLPQNGLQEYGRPPVPAIGGSTF